MADKTSNRIEYLDLLKILAAFGVISGHIVCGSVPLVDMFSRDWHVFNLWQSVYRWVLPVFFMCSGAIFLSKDPQIKKIYTKYIPRMLAAFLFWGVVYSVYSTSEGSFWEYLSKILTGHFHMWYIPTMIGIYIALPLLRQIAKDDKLLKYFVILYLITAIAVPSLLTLASDFLAAGIAGKISTITYLLVKSSPSIVVGYVGYFMIGYYLAKTDFTKKERLIIYIVAIAGSIMTAVCSIGIAAKTGQSLETYYDTNTINIALMSMGVFVWGRYNIKLPSKASKVASFVAKYNFGIYLAHPLIIDILFFDLGMSTFSFGNVLVGVVVMGLLVFALCLIVSLILSKIPVIGKYIV